MTTHALLMLVPMYALLFWAAAMDLRSRRVPNWLTLSVAATGLLQSFFTGHTVTPWYSALGLLVGFALPLLLFAINAIGGADVKLLAGVGAWIGPVGVLFVFATAAIVGLVIVLIQALWQGRTQTLMRNSAVVAINLAHIRQVGVDHVMATGQSCHGVDRPLPYAVPLLIGSLLTTMISWAGR